MGELPSGKQLGGRIRRRAEEKLGGRLNGQPGQGVDERLNGIEVEVDEVAGRRAVGRGFSGAAAVVAMGVGIRLGAGGGLASHPMESGDGFQGTMRHERRPSERQQESQHCLYGPHG